MQKMRMGPLRHLFLTSVFFVLFQASRANATVTANAQISGGGLQITATEGTLQLGDWSTEAFADTNNSLGEFDADFDSTGGIATASASVAFAAAAGNATDEPSVSGDSQIHIPGNLLANAFATGRGHAFTTLQIVNDQANPGDTTSVEFSLMIEALMQGVTDALGSFENEIILALELDGSPILFYSDHQSGGPNSNLLSMDQTQLINTLTLEYNTIYQLDLSADAESSGANVPEPATLVLVMLGMGGVARKVWQKHRRSRLS